MRFSWIVFLRFELSILRVGLIRYFGLILRVVVGMRLNGDSMEKWLLIFGLLRKIWLKLFL